MSAGSELGQTLRGGQLATPLEGGSAVADTVATWDLTIGGASAARYFLVDQSSGSDSNIGYIDAVVGSTLSPTGKAKKTIAGLLAILPRAGAGRKAIILVMNSSTTLGTTYAEHFDLAGVTGYRQLIVRGSTDLTNSVSDRITQGAMIGLAGPNGDGSFTATAGAVGSVTVAAGLTAEISGGGISYMRMRFKGNITAGLANVCVCVWRNSTTVAEFALNGTAPAIGDEFFVERPGVIFTSYREISQSGFGQTTGLAFEAGSTNGIAVTSTTAGGFTVGCDGVRVYSFCETRGATTNAVLTTRAGNSCSMSIIAVFRDETGTQRNLGIGFRCVTGFYLTPRVLLIQSGGFGAITTQSAASLGANALIAAPSPIIGGGLLFRGVRLELASLTVANNFTTAAPLIGPGPQSSTVRRIRTISTGILVIGTGVHIYGLEQEGCSTAGLTFQRDSAGFPAGGGSFIVDDFIDSPSAGNTDVALDVSPNLSGGEVRVGHQTVCTATGTVGDIRLGGPAITPWVGLTQTNVWDANGTNVVGTAKVRVGPAILVTNKSGGALAVGNVVRGNGTTRQVQLSQADTIAKASVQGVMVTPPANNADGYMVAAGIPYVLTDALVTPGNLCYLDDGTAGVGTPTVPPLAATNAKQRLGNAVETASVGTASYVTWRPDNLPVLSDGLA